MEFANKILTTMLGVVLLTSCSKENNEPKENIFIETSVLMRITKSGEIENFLNTINTDNISLHYKENGVLKMLTYPGDYPKGYLIAQEQPVNEKLIKLFCYSGGNNDTEETYIKWNETDIDTLSYNIKRYESGSLVISSIKFNSKPVTNNNQYGIYNVTK